MQDKNTVVHVTHDAVSETGGIGSMIEGLVSSRSYQGAIGRTILIGPVLESHYLQVDGQASSICLNPNDQLLYSFRHGLTDHPYARAFSDVERVFGVSIIYGYRSIRSIEKQASEHPDELLPRIEFILIDAHHARPLPVNALKGWLYDEFGIESTRFEQNTDYELSINFAPAALAALRALGVSLPHNPAVLIAHDVLALPTILAAVLDPLGGYKTVYLAHEVPTVRHITESHPGHDTMMHNVLKWSLAHEYYLPELFGSQEYSFQHALITAAGHCDNIIAVSPRVVDELRFLSPNLCNTPIDLVYQGLPACKISLERKKDSRNRLRQYTQILIDSKPDYLFTHVARMDASKAFWRDLHVLYHLEDMLAQRDQTGVFFVLGTDVSFRPGHERGGMAPAQWDSQMDHHQTDPSLSESETQFYELLQEFNTRNKNIKAIYVNQFGWDSISCGHNMPEDMSFIDMRMGSDLEFGQSIYESFGLSQLEALTFGTLCVVSSICGCSELLNGLEGGHPERVIKADYTQLDATEISREMLLGIGRSERDAIEEQVSRQVAGLIEERLFDSPKTANDQILEEGYLVSRQMSWNAVCKKYFLPALKRAYHHRRHRHIA